MGYEISAGAVGKAIGNGIQSFANHSAAAASRANGVSAAAQRAQGTFNQNSANIANNIGTDRIAQQYAFNSGAAMDADQFSLDMWNRSAAWNEEMFERQMEFNHNEAQLQRDWQQKMLETAYQRAVADMSKAGLNPILAVTGGGISTGAGSSSAASVGQPQMSPISGHMASGGLMNGLSASEGNYTGQMEYMGGMLGLLSAAIGGISSAMQAFGGMGDVGKGIGEALAGILDPNVKSPWGGLEWDKNSWTYKLFNGHKHSGSSGSFGNDFKNVLRNNNPKK